MPIINAKVYNDGSFPIAIPPNLNPPPKRKGKAKEYLAKISFPISEDENTPPSEKEKEIAKYAKNHKLDDYFDTYHAGLLHSSHSMLAFLKLKQTVKNGSFDIASIK